MSKKSVIYIVGEEPTARSSELSTVLQEIIGNEDRSLVLDSHDLSDADTDETRTTIIENAVSCLQSPPFLTSKRVVVIRDIGAGSNDNVASLINYLNDPLETSFFVAVQGGGRISTQLTKAWKPIVEQRGKAREDINDLLSRLMREYAISFEPGLREQIIAHCGQDSSKLAALLERLKSVYGTNTKLSANDVRSYMGESGNVAIYELSNEICSGNTQKALEIISRMLHSTSAQNAKPMHPLQIISLISGHFRKLATLDDSSIRNQADAHAALGGKGNPYGAKLSWQLSRKLGSVTIASCIEIIGSTDTITKGANAIDGTIATELLVISLCGLCSQNSQKENAQLRKTYNNALYI